jgi:2-amino-4-hydroxy-6-hydroxymethyldihydropteridine diphosphokinase
MTKPTLVYIGLGSNLGDRQSCIRNALKMLADIPGVEVLHNSDIIETAPLAGLNQPKYVNCVAEIKTILSAQTLYQKMSQIENSLGRVRQEKWLPRTIDLDLLLFGNEIINTAELTIPHPQMHLRSFVLKGICQLNPEFEHPVIKVSAAELARRLNGCDFVLKADLPQLISIAGVIGVGKTTLTKKLAARFGGKQLFEPYDTNPFLPQVYAGEKELALDSQLYFLASRLGQLTPAALTLGAPVISDYIFDQEIIYAKRLLNPEQLALHEQIYLPLSKMVALPVLVIYLKDTARNCLTRIVKRNRPYEQKIDPKFLDAFESDYENFFNNWKTCPVIRIQLCEFDCTKPADVDNLSNQIKSYISVKNL